MKQVAIIVIKYSGILLISFVDLWWLMFLSPFNIPEFIPHTPIKIYGLFLTGFILTILILSEKELLKKNAALSIFNLTLIGTTICFINELIFHFILSLTEPSDKLRYFIDGVTSTTIFCAFLSFFVAFQLKTKRTERLVFFIFLFGVLFSLITKAFPTLVNP